MAINNSYQYLLDTNIISELVKNPQGKVAQQVIDAGNEKICTSIIVASELRFGIKKRGSKKLTEQVESILDAINILPYETSVDNHYAILRNYLEKKGTPIGPNNMLIAAHALELNLILVTANIKEFSRVPELKIQNWIEV